MGDFVWSDTNGNGIQDAGEPGLSGVLVNLFTCGSVVPFATATTDATGHYSFTGLPPGSYYIHFGTLTGFTFSPQGIDPTFTIGNDSNADASGNTVCFPLAAGENNITIDAGLIPPTGKTVRIGPSSMEGDLKNIEPGDWVNAGYHFNLGNKLHPAEVVTVSGSVSLAVKCSDGTTPAGSPIVIPLTTQTYTVAAGNTNWVPSGDQLSVLNWQGAVQAPDLCAGIGTGEMRNQIGAVFTGTFSANPPTSPINIQFHYRDPAAKGKPDTNCTDINDPNRNRADVCGASWSQTVDP